MPEAVEKDDLSDEELEKRFERDMANFKDKLKEYFSE